MLMSSEISAEFPYTSAVKSYSQKVHQVEVTEDSNDNVAISFAC